MGEVIQFKRPVVKTDLELRMERIVASAQRLNALMAELNKKQGG